MLIGFIIGLFVGTAIGIFIAALMNANGEDDE